MSEHCDPKQAALKSYFLGPQAENADWLGFQLSQLLRSYSVWRRKLHPEDGTAISFQDQSLPEYQACVKNLDLAIAELLARFENELPKFSPRYIAHMVSEVSLPALMGHIIALFHNPNLITAEAAREAAQIESEAIFFLADMLGFSRETVQGHFCSGGTVANFEALSRFKVLTQRDPKVERHFIIPAHAHYSWKKGLQLFFDSDRIQVHTLPLTHEGSADLGELRILLERIKGSVFLVSVLGTTEMGSIDPVAEQVALLHEYRLAHPPSRVWHHVDAAYGGFLCALSRAQIDSLGLPNSFEADLQAVSRVDSVTMDPHKWGYVAYACGAFICRNTEDYICTIEKAPYIHYEGNFDRGPYTLEGSRAGTGAAAVWLTAKTLGFHDQGLGQLISRSIGLCQELERGLRSARVPIRIWGPVQTNLVVFSVEKAGLNNDELNKLNLKIFNQLNKPETPFLLSKTVIDSVRYPHWIADGKRDVLRVCLMNPYIESQEMTMEWQKSLIEILEKAALN